MLTEGKTRGSMSPKRNKGTRCPVSGPPAARKDLAALARRERRMQERFERRAKVVKAFKCSCGARFSEKVLKDKMKTACRECKGIAKVWDTQHKPPIWQRIIRTVPFCPVCGAEMQRTSGDVATVFNWKCSNSLCRHVC